MNISIKGASTATRKPLTLISTHAGFSNSSKRIKNRGGKVTTHINDASIISIVGTIGLFGKIHHSLNQANLTENCVKLTDIHTITPDYLYYTLCYKKLTKEIELLTVGAVQAKLPIYNIQSMNILVPPQDIIQNFQCYINIFNSIIETNTVEMQRLYDLQETILAKLSD